MSNGLEPDQDRENLSVLIWVQTVCKGCQQTTKFDSNQAFLFMILSSSVEFFKINFFLKKSFRSAIRISNGLEPDQDRQNLSVLICVQTVCKGCQQTTKFDSNQVVIFENEKVGETGIHRMIFFFSK